MRLERAGITQESCHSATFHFTLHQPFFTTVLKFLRDLRRIALLMALAMVASLAACGDESTSSGDTTAADNTSAAVTTEPAYDYPALNYKGENFTILSPTNNWGIIDTIDVETQNGELLNDAIYERNVRLMEQYNFKFEEIFEEK